ncbi:MAG: FAD-dependent oxidoreductase [Acidobacteria bacterium]|nr:FAD-dependent oxidoreductase [Acidobacteriota bacterium]
MIATLLEYRDLSSTIRHFTFEVPERLDFQPGQFASLNAMVGGKEITRAYSLAAASKGDNRFEICLNLVEDGVFSPHLFALKVGENVLLKGIYGAFLWRQPPMDTILVATGTGIVPFRAMLQDHYCRGSEKRDITLIYGTRHAENLLWAEEFRALEANHAGFRFVPTVTRPDQDWKGEAGRVQPILLGLLGDRKDVQVYACGLKEMVDSVRALCKERGLERRQIIFEKYD